MRLNDREKKTIQKRMMRQNESEMRKEIIPSLMTTREAGL